MDTLLFGNGNAKLVGVYTFSLPAGWTCPGANECLSRADRQTGKVTDGPNTMFRCFAATMEARPTVRNARWRNFDIVKAALRSGGASKAAELILASLPKDATTIRVHVSGDFFSAEYFKAWCLVATARPDVLFYAYTKSIGTWQSHNVHVPANFVLTTSVGGREDELIEALELRRAVVVNYEEDAMLHGLEIDHDDSLAMNPDVQAFALLIHGTQPAGTPEAKAWQQHRKAGKGYGRKPLPTV